MIHHRNVKEIKQHEAYIDLCLKSCVIAASTPLFSTGLNGWLNYDFQKDETRIEHVKLSEYLKLYSICEAQH